MKNSKKILSLALAGAMLVGSAGSTLAAVEHIIVKDKAYKMADLGNEGYRKAMELAVAEAGPSEVYISDNEGLGKTVKLVDLVTGNYNADFANAPNKASEVASDVKLVKGDLTQGDSIKVQGKEEAEDGKLKVESVSAINKTEVVLNLSGVEEELPAASTFQVSDSNGKVYAATGIAKNTDGTYILTLGTAVEGSGILTVKYGSSEANLSFDTTMQGITLGIAVEDGDSTLVADGADNTMITVSLLRNGELDEAFDGTVKFQSLKGATFAKETVAFDKGIARVQLTSMSSVIEIVDTIRATISDADDIEAVGKAVETQILYKPADANADVGNQVFITYAESNQTGNIYVKFNKDIDFDKIYKDFKANPTTLLTVTDSTNGGVQPVDIIKINKDTIQLVLSETNAVNDNDTILVTGTNTNNVTGSLINGGVSFNLVDPKAPEALSVATPDYRTIVVRFTEPVHSSTTDVPENWVLNGKQLSAADFDGGIPTVGAYSVATTTKKADDQRSYVTLKLTADGAAKLKASGSDNLLQAYDIIDYAGNTDVTGQNKATTQEFRFKTPEAPAAPTAVVTQDSPEQFRVKFTSPLKAALNASDFEFKYQTDVNTDGTPVWGGTVALEDTNTDVAKAKVTNIGGSDNNEYLIELNEDWTVKLDTAATGINYYAPKHNKVQITAKKKDAKNNADVQMVEDKVQVLTMKLDSRSPEISEVKQTLDVNGVGEQNVRVKMDEPVQIDMTSGTDPLTPSQTQGGTAGGGTGTVPTPTFQFVNADESVTIDGKLNGAIDEQDMIFNVEPEAGKQLTSGTWTLYIRSISDDVGNTSATTSAKVTIVAEEASLADPIIVWADVHDNVTTATGFEDVVHIQFAKEMSLDALKSSMYTINGNILPQGVSITSAETYYDMNNDGAIDSDDTRKGTLITIRLPKEFLGDVTANAGDAIDTSNTGNNVLNVSKSLTDADGNKIKGLTEVKMSYDFDGSPVFIHPNTVTLSSVKEETKGILGVTTTPAVPAKTEQYTLAVTSAAVTTDGNITVAVTSPAVSETVAVLQTDSKADIAGKIATALGSQVTGYTVAASGDNVVLTSTTSGVNQTDLVVTVTDTDTTGAVASGSVTTQGAALVPAVVSAGTAEVGSFKVLTGSRFGNAIEVTVKDGNKKLGANGVTVSVTLATGDTAAQVATKIQAALALSGVEAHYAATVSTNEITLTQADNVTGGDVTLDVTVKY